MKTKVVGRLQRLLLHQDTTGLETLGLLAHSPGWFSNSVGIVRSPRVARRKQFSMTNIGIHVHAIFLLKKHLSIYNNDVDAEELGETYLIQLNYYARGTADLGGLIFILLR